jgi:hypothetical protein
MKIGDLIQVRESIPFGPPVGSVGIVDFVQMQRVCVKGGIVGRSSDCGGPVHSEEKAVVAMFDARRRRLHFLERYDIVGRI